MKTRATVLGLFMLVFAALACNYPGILLSGEDDENDSTRNFLRTVDAATRQALYTIQAATAESMPEETDSPPSAEATGQPAQDATASPNSAAGEYRGKIVLHTQGDEGALEVESVTENYFNLIVSEDGTVSGDGSYVFDYKTTNADCLLTGTRWDDFTLTGKMQGSTGSAQLFIVSNATQHDSCYSTLDFEASFEEPVNLTLQGDTLKGTSQSGAFTFSATKG